MRHGCKKRKLNRTRSHRKALLRNLSIALLLHERIRTTLPKAKELRKFLEPILTMAKSPSLHRRRRIFSILRDKGIVHKLFEELVPRYKSRPGGYLRIIKMGFRVGDAAPMACVEMVDQSCPVALAA